MELMRATLTRMHEIPSWNNVRWRQFNSIQVNSVFAQDKKFREQVNKKTVVRTVIDTRFLDQVLYVTSPYETPRSVARGHQLLAHCPHTNTLSCIISCHITSRQVRSGHSTSLHVTSRQPRVSRRKEKKSMEPQPLRTQENILPK